MKKKDIICKNCENNEEFYVKEQYKGVCYTYIRTDNEGQTIQECTIMQCINQKANLYIVLIVIVEFAKLKTQKICTYRWSNDIRIKRHVIL